MFLEAGDCVAVGFSLGASAAGLQGRAFLRGPTAGHPRGTPIPSRPKTRIALLFYCPPALVDNTVYQIKRLFCITSLFKKATP